MRNRRCRNEKVERARVDRLLLGPQPRADRGIALAIGLVTGRTFTALSI